MGNKLSKLKQSEESIATFDVILLHDEDYLIRAFIHQNASSLPMSLCDLIQLYFPYAHSNSLKLNTGSWIFNAVSCKPFILKQRQYHKLMRFKVSETDISLVISVQCKKSKTRPAAVFGQPAELNIYCHTMPTLKKLHVKYIIFYYELTTKTHDYGIPDQYKMGCNRGIVCIKDTDNYMKMYKIDIVHSITGDRLLGDDGFFEQRSLFIDILNIHYEQKDFIRCNHVTIGSSCKYHAEFVIHRYPEQHNTFSPRFGENNLFYLEFSNYIKEDSGVLVVLHCNYMGMLLVKIHSTLNEDNSHDIENPFMEETQYQHKFNVMQDTLRSVAIHKLKMKIKREQHKFKIALTLDILKHTPLCQLNY